MVGLLVNHDVCCNRVVGFHQELGKFLVNSIRLVNKKKSRVGLWIEHISLASPSAYSPSIFQVLVFQEYPYDSTILE